MTRFDKSDGLESVESSWAGTIAWASFFGFGGVLCLSEGLALVFKEDPQPRSAFLDFVCGAFAASPIPASTAAAGAVFVIASFVLLAVKWFRLKKAPGLDGDVALGYFGLLITSWAVVAALFDSWLEGLGTIGMGLVGIGLTVWSVYRALKKKGRLPRRRPVIGSRRPPVTSIRWTHSRLQDSRPTEGP